MSLDEILFTLALRLKRAVWRDRAHAAELVRGMRLADLRAHLTLVARALSGAPLDIQKRNTSAALPATCSTCRAP